MAKPKVSNPSPLTQQETANVTICRETYEGILEVLEMIVEFQTLTAHADDFPWHIVKMMADKANRLADDLVEK